MSGASQLLKHSSADIRVWLSIACWTVCALGYGALFRSFDYNAEVHTHPPDSKETQANAQWIAFTPRIGYTLLFVLSVAIGELGRHKRPTKADCRCGRARVVLVAHIHGHEGRNID